MKITAQFSRLDHILGVLQLIGVPFKIGNEPWQHFVQTALTESGSDKQVERRPIVDQDLPPPIHDHSPVRVHPDLFDEVVDGAGGVVVAMRDLEPIELGGEQQQSGGHCHTQVAEPTPEIPTAAVLSKGHRLPE